MAAKKKKTRSSSAKMSPAARKTYLARRAKAREQLRVAKALERRNAFVAAFADVLKAAGAQKRERAITAICRMSGEQLIEGGLVDAATVAAARKGSVPAQEKLLSLRAVGQRAQRDLATFFLALVADGRTGKLEVRKPATAK